MTGPQVSIGDEGALDSELNPSLYDVWLDRDVSWLDFNERVLAEALDDRVPLLERLKFLAIFSSNQDEFFMKRIAVLREGATPERLHLLEQLRSKMVPMLESQANCFRKLVPQLATHGIYLRSWGELTERQRSEACAYFDLQISPALTPLVINPAEPFPFLSNLSLSIMAVLQDPLGGTHLSARVKVPTAIQQWVSLRCDLEPKQRLFVPLHEVIRENLGKLYPGMTLSGYTLVRLTRDAEVAMEERRTESVRALVQEQVRRRRFEPVVRLEISSDADHSIRKLLQEHFALQAHDIWEITNNIDYTTLFEIAFLDFPDLKDLPWNPTTPPPLGDGKDIFSLLRTSDLLVHHPYESFDASVEAFIKKAAEDPQTVSIKMTAYRVGDDTPFVKSLIHAAEAGKQVACVIELHARFDEERNLHWAAALEKSGAHVSYGVRGLKIHGKTALVVRKEPNGLRAYAHVGTGNYHVRTARLYCDVGLLTSDPHVTADVVQLFHYLTGHSHEPDLKSLLVAPRNMRARFLALIRREAELKQQGRSARIVAKMNQLEDPEIIEALCEASRAGVPIDLIIRGFCCLRPGVAGASENIRVRSIIGRFLEHSRIYFFGAGAGDPIDGEFYIGSADWMYRNLSKRVEVVTPVNAREPRRRLWEILDLCLRDRRQAWMLHESGQYGRLTGENYNGPGELGVHAELMELARRRAHGE